MHDPVRVATIGTGYFSQFHLKAWRRLAEEGHVDLVGVCDVDVTRAERAATSYRIAGVFADIDDMLRMTQPAVVDIITPPHTHVDLVSKALKHEVTVICQKPFTPSLREAKRLQRKAEAKQRLLIVHENFRFQPWYIRIRQALDENLLGELYQMTFRLQPGDGQGPSAYLDRQPYFRSMLRFLIHETAVHLVDVFRYLAGDVVSVYAQLDKRNHVIAGEDCGLIIFEFANAIRAVFDGNRLVDHAACNRRLTMGEMLLEGSKGSLSLTGDGALLFRRLGENNSTPIEYEWSARDFGGDCVYRLQSHVVDHLTSRAPLVNSASQYLENLRIVDAIYKSADSARRVNLTTGGDR